MYIWNDEILKNYQLPGCIKLADIIRFLKGHNEKFDNNCKTFSVSHALSKVSEDSLILLDINNKEFFAVPHRVCPKFKLFQKSHKN